MMDIALIVAMAQNGIIGRDNQLPWHLPEDLRYFKKTTMGKPIIMGRKTFESIGKPLPGRVNIVISTQNIKLPESVRLVHSVSEAMQVAESICRTQNIDEVMVIGGEQIYALFMPIATRIYLTKVHANVEGDASFSYFKEGQWLVMNEQRFSASDNNPYDYSFCMLERK